MAGDGAVEVLSRAEVSDADPQVVDVATPSGVAVADSFDAVPVGIAQERAVVIGPVLGALAGAPSSA
jgi:hypothetical protein